MKFANLYRENRQAVERALRAIWCGETGNESQAAYAKQLREVIKDLFAPKEAVPVVQCMNSYEPVHSVAADEAKALVGKLWTSTKFQPYEHQYQSWHTLLKDKTDDDLPMSICVTTGTGSGKTECFMMPLVHDLECQGVKDQIQALFLYPLNALMEDQKERLEELLKGTDLTYTVYNGDLPEDEPKATDHSDGAEKRRRAIAQVRGEERDKEGNLVRYKYPKMVYTRKMVRKNPPNILLTNPTMLEYILLRDSDKTLMNPALQSLKWVVIDETHTYTGAGAAELAMLLRRVLLAFGVKASKLHFATSSATFGNATTPEEQKKAEEKLQDFIAGVTGVQKKQVRVIGGKRIGETEIPTGQDNERWTKLFREEYVTLDELFPNESSIEEKLRLLDEMCDRVPKDKDNNPILKAKVHYFYRVPNNGMFARLVEHENGAFKIYTKNTITSEDNRAYVSTKEKKDDVPLLELSRCKRCGEYVALARINQAPDPNFGVYEALDRDDSDMFDLEEENEDAEKKYAVIGLAKGKTSKGDNNVPYRAVGNKLMPLSFKDMEEDEWHLMVNTHCSCPYCNSKLTKQKDSDDEQDSTATEEDMESAYLQKFRLSPDFISRLLAPSVLNELEKGKSKDPEKLVLHDGQQYISFADSRQLAAKTTLKQNLEQERLWFYSTVFHELCRRKANEEEWKREIRKWRTIMSSDDASEEEYEEAEARVKQLKGLTKGYLNWTDIATLLKKSKYCATYCAQFVKQTTDSEEMQDGAIKPFMMDKYIQSIMVLYLAKRPHSAAAPETLGLFQTHYPQLTKIKLPSAVENFNELLKNEANKISEKDWHDLIQVFIDYHVRSNESVYLKLSDDNSIDINACQRFATEKPRRRSVKKPTFERGKTSTSRIIKFLSALIIRENSSLRSADVQRIYFDDIAAVIDAFWHDLTNKDNKLLEQSEHWDEEKRGFAPDKEGAMRLNLKNLAVKLYDEAWLCDTNSTTAGRHVKCLRPVENHFKDFSPYLVNNEPVVLDDTLHEVWTPYPFYCNEEKERPTKEMLDKWAAENRKLLWNNHLWGDDGVFTNHLENVHLMPNLFVQAEHTAQVDKMVARNLQTKFKDHTVNILACSTTMEMGVDLGNLEVVMLTSVPPMPSNYKQRVGRSGRNNKVRSACITLCGSDAIGLRTLLHPKESIINRAVKVPMVDLMSPQVVQRHANSYLVRAFGVFTDGENGGKLTQGVVDYYTTFHIHNEGGRLVVKGSDNETKDPTDKLGEQTGTMYELFNKKCSELLNPEIRAGLEELLAGTVYSGHTSYVVKKAREANTRCYEELCIKLEDYASAYSGASEKFTNKLNMQYLEVLNNRLLNFWATSRFTPNANMPVNVLTLDLNTSGKKNFYTSMTSSNPSYGLREAIAQYAPGNTIVVDGVSYIVRGIEFANMYQGVRAFKQIYRNSEKCVIDDPSIGDKIYWDVNGKEAVELIQPVGFIPDMNEEKSRITDTNRYTRVSAQLIDTDDWQNTVKEPHLFSVRSNRDTGNAKILYYNEGLGYGYCFCQRCGRMVLETEVADGENSLDKLPEEMNPKQPKDLDKPKYHQAIGGKEFRKRCTGSRNSEAIRRNVIIGDLVLTDYAEIRIRHKGKKHWISSREKEENLLFTLGIIFTQSLVDLLGKERGAVDFAIMPNGHICVFDTNPGGAGYANQMASVPLMKEVIGLSKNILMLAKAKNSKDMLLDKFTLRFMNYMDIDEALAWIKEEEESCEGLPEPINTLFPTASETSLDNLQRAFASSSQMSVLFANNTYNSWDYEGEESGWRCLQLDYFIGRGSLTEFCIIETEQHTMPEPIKEMGRSIKAWAKGLKHIKNPYGDKEIYPLAYVDDILYFTNDKEFASLNGKWGNSTIYCTRTNSITDDARDVDCAYTDSTVVFKLQNEDAEEICTKELGDVIQKHASKIVEKFLTHCKQTDKELKVTYQDEHLKSVMGMVLTLQTIEHFIKQIGHDFCIEFKVEEYTDNTLKQSITANLADYHQRDQHLTDLTEGWLNDMNNDYKIVGKLIPVKSKSRHSLTHWRELSLECDGIRLSIYPDGGFANGWNLNKNKGGNTKFYKIENTDTRDSIGVIRSQDIKYDVTIE